MRRQIDDRRGEVVGEGYHHAAGEPKPWAADEHMRPDTTMQSLASLKPSFVDMGALGFDAVVEKPCWSDFGALGQHAGPEDLEREEVVEVARVTRL